MLVIQRSEGLLTIAMNGCDDKGRCSCVWVGAVRGIGGSPCETGCGAGVRRCKREDEMRVRMRMRKVYAMSKICARLEI